MGRGGLKLGWALAIATCVVLSACAPKPGTRPFGAKPFVDHGLRGTLYNLPKGTNRLPDFAKLSPKGTLFTRQLNGPPQNDVNGFDGVTDRNEWFGFTYRTRMTVAAAGTYGFRLFSDDGSRLLIDGRTVIDNDGVHTPTSLAGSVALNAGPHAVEVQYFKGPHYLAALQFYCAAPGRNEALFPNCGGLTLDTPTQLSDHLWWIWLGGLFVIAAGWWLLRGRRAGG